MTPDEYWTSLDALGVAQSRGDPCGLERKPRAQLAPKPRIFRQRLLTNPTSYQRQPGKRDATLTSSAGTLAAVMNRRRTNELLIGIRGAKLPKFDTEAIRSA